MAGRQDIEAGAAFLRLFLKDDMTRDLRNVLNGVGGTLKSVGAQVATVGAGVTAAGTAILGPIVAAVGHFVKVGDDLGDMSARTGVAASALAEFGYAATLTGTSLEQVEPALLKMQRTLGDAIGGSKSARKAFSDLGLSWQELQKLSPEAQFQAVADALGKADETEQLAKATDIFGRSVGTLLPMLRDLGKLREDARAEGLIPSDESVKAAGAIDDSLNKLQMTVSSLVYEIGSSLSEEILAIVEGARTVVKAVRDWVKENIGLVKIAAAVGVVLVAAGTAITVLGGLLIAAGFAASGLATVIGVVGSAIGLLLSPIGLATAAIVGVVVAWATFTESGQESVGIVKTALGELFEFAKEVFGGISDALISGDLKLAAEIAFTGLQLAAMETLIALRGLFGDAITGIVGRLLQGDIAGAWSDTVSQLGLLWASFSEMVINTMSAMAKTIIDTWQSVTTFIAQKILELSASPAFNAFLAGAGLSGAGRGLTGGVNVAAEVERGKNLGVDDPLGDMKNAAAGIITGQANDLLAQIDAINKAARAATDDAAKNANDSAKSGIDALYDSLQKKRDDFNRARGQAADQAAAKALGKKAAEGAEEAGSKGIGANFKNLITFSAASAAAAGYMGSGMQRSPELQKQEEISKNTKDIATETKNVVAAVKELANSLVYGT